MLLSEIVYALFWGLRFDLAPAALLSLLSCFILWFYYRFLPAKDSAFFLLGVMLLMQMSLQIGDTVYFAEAGRHVSYDMRDALTDASGLFITAVTKHGGLLNAQSLSCDKQHKAQSIKSLVFTSYSQHLLFSGKTRNFYEFYKQ